MHIFLQGNICFSQENAENCSHDHSHVGTMPGTCRQDLQAFCLYLHMGCQFESCRALSEPWRCSSVLLQFIEKYKLTASVVEGTDCCEWRSCVCRAPHSHADFKMWQQMWGGETPASCQREGGFWQWEPCEYRASPKIRPTPIRPSRIFGKGCNISPTPKISPSKVH